MRAAALLLLAALLFTATACGGSDITAESPRTTPDLTIPTTADEGGAEPGVVDVGARPAQQIAVEDEDPHRAGP